MRSTGPLGDAHLVEVLAQDEREVVVLEGFHAVKHAVRFGAHIRACVSDRVEQLVELSEELAPDLVDFFRHRAQRISPETLRSLATPVPPTHVVAFANRPAPVDASEWSGTERTSPGVFLEDPQNLGNLGAVVRVAAAAGAFGVLTSGDRDPWSRGAIRGAAGLQFALPVGRISIHETTVWPRPLVALDPGGGDLRASSIPPDAVLAFGTERNGLSPSVLRQADLRLRIPMMPGVSSLNLATSVAVALYAWRLARAPAADSVE